MVQIEVAEHAMAGGRKVRPYAITTSVGRPEEYTPLSKMILSELLLEELRDFFGRLGEKYYRADQLASWLFEKKIQDFNQMSNLPRAMRAKLAAHAQCLGTKVLKTLQSRDGTLKFLIELPDHSLIESVIIPESGRVTLCISSQVGCPVRCIFCASGRGGFHRNLTHGEMVEQFLHASSALPKDARITNVVFMGMGEPLLNLENLRRALVTLTSSWGMSLGARRITISTVGIHAALGSLSDGEVVPNLAISLHAPLDDLRRRLIPGTKSPSVASLVKTAASYGERTRRDVTFEYILIKDLNSSTDHARRLATLVEKSGCKVNLIRYNPVHGLSLAPPDEEAVAAFAAILRKRAVLATIRKSRGPDIDAACGQLALLPPEIDRN